MPLPSGAVVLPDVEKIVILALLSFLGDEITPCTETPEDPKFTQSLPIVRIMRIGGLRGTRTWGGTSLTGQARISVDVYAADRESVNLAVEKTRAAIESMQGNVWASGLVTRTWEETGPTVRPEEPNTGIVRIGFVVGVEILPATS